MGAVGRLVRRKDVTNEAPGVLRHRWAVLGMAGAVQFVLFEYLPSGPQFEALRAIPGICVATTDGHLWQGVDVGTHSPRKMFDGQAPMGSCDLLEGDCWYDGSSLQAIYLLEAVLVRGEIMDDLVWTHLENYYPQAFL